MSKLPFAQGHDNEGALQPLPFHCEYAGILFPERVYGLDGSADEKGAGYTPLIYKLTWANYRTLLTAFGFSSTTSGEATVEGTITLEPTPGETPVNYNCTIERPKLQDNIRHGAAFRTFEVMVKDLEEIP